MARLAQEYAERAEAEFPCNEADLAGDVSCFKTRLDEIDKQIDAMIIRAQDEVYSQSEEGVAFYRSNIQSAQDHWREYRRLQCWHNYGREGRSSRFTQGVNFRCELGQSYYRMAEIEQSMFVIPR